MSTIFSPCIERLDEPSWTFLRAGSTVSCIPQLRLAVSSSAGSWKWTVCSRPRPECVPSAPTQQLAALKTSGGLGNSMWGGGVRVWQQQGARGGGRGQAEGTRARGGLLGQNQEAGQSGHIPFPLADELSIQNAGEGRERHLFLIGGSNEHAESVPVVG